MKKVILALVGVLVAGGVFAQVADLDTLRGKYGAAKARIETDCGKAKETAKAGYGTALTVAMASYKKGGNLDAYLAADKAKKQFDVDGMVPEDGGTDLDGAVRVYRDAVKRADSDASAKMYSLNQGYTSQLEPLIKQFMLADKIDDAKKVKDELERVKFELADIESKQPKVEGTNVAEGVADTNKASKLRYGGKKLEIIEATWGIDKRQVDITEFLQKIVKNGKLDFANDDSSAAVLAQHGIKDPAWGAYKVVTITYRVKNGKIEKKEWNKYERIVLP